MYVLCKSVLDRNSLSVLLQVWTGVPIHEIIKHCGGLKDQAEYINFFGPVGEVQNGDRTYGASHFRDHMMDPKRTAMLAFMQNGELLHPDHGYPVRLLIPGYIGGRMIKWVEKITVTAEEDKNWSAAAAPWDRSSPD